MKDTSNFRTKTSYIEKLNGKRVDGKWLIALDLGYSAVKVFSTNAIGRFPSYAKRVNGDFQYVSDAPKNSIIYKDLNTGATWLVGEKAQDIMNDLDTSDSEATLYGRDRYFSPIFKIITAVGLAMGMRNNDVACRNSSDEIIVQTGLPQRYMNDEADIIESIAGKYDFAVKFGNSDYEEYHFTIASNNVYVMSQPKGTLFSVVSNDMGIPTADAVNFLSSSVIIFDAGFGTLDLFPILSQVVQPGETYEDLGMKRVLQETTNDISKEYGINIPVPAMQKYLETGKVKSYDKKTFTSSEHSFGDILASASEKICKEAIMRMSDALRLDEYKYLIITGGTGAAWYEQIKSTLSGLETLTVVNAKPSSDLQLVFCNVRGYYNRRLGQLIAAA